MSTGRSVGLNMALTLLLVVAISISSVGAQQCSFPSPWMYKWWLGNYPATNSRQFRSFGFAYETNYEQVGGGPLNQISTYDCQEEQDSDPFMYYVRRNSANIGIEECVKGYSDNTVTGVTDAKLLVTQSSSTGTTGYRASQCLTDTNLANSQVNVFVRWSETTGFDFSDVECPFSSGRYLVSLSTVSAGEDKCLDNRESYAIVDSGKVTFQTCEDGSTYEKPFSGVTLECVGDIAPTYIQATALDGNVLILGHKTANDYYNFYTMRYQVASTGAIVMSLQGSTSGLLQPDPSKKFTTVGVVGSEFSYAMVMQPASCSNDNINCENGGTCRDNTDGTYGFTCVCQTGYTGTYCETDIDDCPAGDCSGNGDCTDLINDYQCVCDAGYVGKDCETRDYCYNDPCGTHGECRSLATSFQCTCDAGYTGATCDIQQHCYSSPCQNGGLCREETNGYSCSCQAGYVGTNCETYQYCYEKPCVFGSCTEGTGTYICTCQDGYAGTRCDRALQCYNNPCRNGGVCTETADGLSYTCACPPGFSDPICSTVLRCYNHQCMHGATCVEENNSYMCICPTGYTGWNCGSELHCSSQPCRNGAQCIEEANTYSCNCNPGWTGYNCDTQDLCSALPCRNGGQCIETSNGVQCNCLEGYSGEFCTIVAGCAGSDPCVNGQCQDMPDGGTTCLCDAGWTGINCQTLAATTCDGVVCQNGGTCEARSNGFKCSCALGYSGTFCETDACDPNPCKNGGECTRRDDIFFEDGFSCECTEGWGGPTCVLAGGCNADTCERGSCEQDQGEDKCMCEDGWKGDRCDEEEDFDWTILVIVLVVVLVLVFIILAILVCACCVMRNNNGGGSNEAKPKPGPVTPSGPVVREIIIPPQSVQVVDASKQPQLQQQPQNMMVAKPPTMINTRAMFMSDNPQKIYSVNNPLDTTYALPPPNPYGTRNPQGSVRFVGGLQPPGQQASKGQDIDASVYPDIDASDYIKFGASALKGASS